MKRFQLFEIEDQAFLPVSIRDALTDYLQFVTARTQPYAPIIPQLEHALAMPDKLLTSAQAARDRGFHCIEQCGNPVPRRFC